jgi:hypothetical protein
LDQSLQISDERIMRLAGAMYNASCTILRLRKEENSSYGYERAGNRTFLNFNGVPHLAAPGGAPTAN